MEFEKGLESFSKAEKGEGGSAPILANIIFKKLGALGALGATQPKTFARGRRAKVPRLSPP